jgi:hypothetical protein
MNILFVLFENERYDTAMILNTYIVISCGTV